MFAMGIDRLITERIPLVAGMLWREMGPLLIFAVIGAFSFRDKRIFALLMASLVCNLTFTLNYEINDIRVYIIPAVLMLTLLVGMGLQVCADHLPAGRPAAAAVFMLAMPAVMLVSHYESVSQHGNTEDAERIESLLDAVGENVLLVGFDYEDYHYIAYHLVGEGMQNERNIYIMRFFRPQEIAEHCLRGIPVTLVDQNMNTPSGLTVYVQNKKYLKQLHEQGLITTPMEFGLWRVEAPFQPSHEESQ